MHTHAHHCAVPHCTAPTPTPAAPAQVQFLPGGPLATDARRPLSFRLDPLPPAEHTEWDVRLAIAGFGGPVLQPSILVPVRVGGKGASPSSGCYFSVF